ncbi:MAG: ribosome assembly RNA-binding protein YhbY [Myxococcota bacterium]|nr:ribosome assembly RNA-binding protein YhbY [Myxococcota bacterium]
MALKGKDRRELRGMGHHLSPVVQIGQNGVTEGVIGATRQALEDHELIKVKIGDGPEDRHEAAEHLARETKSEIAQVLGKTALLFKKRAKDSKFDNLGKKPAAKPETGKKKAGAAKAAPVEEDAEADADADADSDSEDEDEDEGSDHDDEEEADDEE